MNNMVTIGTLLVLALLPAYLLRFDIFGVPTTALEIILLVIFVLWLWQNKKRLKELFVIERQWSIAIALVILSATIGAIVAPNALVALGIWKAYFIEPVLFFFLLNDLLRKEQITSKQILLSLMIGGLLVAFAAFVQWIFWTGIPTPWDVERRVTGLFDYPNALGLYLGPLVILAIGQLVSSQTKSTKLFCVGCALVFFLAIILAQSEAAMASTVVTIMIMGLVHKPRRNKTILFSFIALSLIVLFPFSRQFVIQKITLQDYSGQVRLSQWRETIELLKDKPIFGAGLSGYPTALLPYHQDKHLEIFQYPHNIFLNVWVELGLLGLFTFLFFAFLVLKSITARSLTTFPLYLFPFLQIFLHGLVDVPYFKNDLAIFTWTLLALLYFTSKQKELHQPQP